MTFFAALVRNVGLKTTLIAKDAKERMNFDKQIEMLFIEAERVVVESKDI